MLNLFADFEYNGQPNLEIIQFGAVLTTEDCTVLSHFTKYVKPDLPITKYVEKLTGIYNDRISTASDFLSVFASFFCWLDEYRNEEITFYAWGEDWKQLKRIAKKHDCLELFDKIMKRNNRINYQRELSKKTLCNGQMMSKALKLDDVKKLYQIPNKVAHDALIDAVDTLLVYKAVEIDGKIIDENQLLRIFDEKADHIKKMREETKEHTKSLFKPLIPIHQNKTVYIDNLMFRKLKSGTGVLFKEIESDINDSTIFSKKRECKYLDNSISIILTLVLDGDCIILEFDVMQDSCNKGSHKVVLNDGNEKFIARLLSNKATHLPLQ